MPQSQANQGPLTDKQYEQINQQMLNLARLQQDIDQAKTAGIQCDEHDQNCQYLQGRLSQIKKAYFPNRP
jgi:hypothetical protein